MDKIKRIFNAERCIVKTAFSSDKKSSTLFLLLSCLNHLVPLFSVLIWGNIIDCFVEITNQKSMVSKIFIYLVLYVSLELFNLILKKLWFFLFEKIRNEATHHMDVSIMKKMSEVDSEFFDNPTNQDARKAAEESSDYIADQVTAMIEHISEYFSLISAIVILLSYNWIVGMAYLLTFIPGGILSFIQNKRNDNYSLSKIPFEKEKDYYKYILTGEYYAKELRIYNLAERYKKKYNEIWQTIRQKRKELFTKGVLFALLGSLISFSGFAFIVLFSTYSVVIGTMTVGSLVVFIGLAKNAGDELKRSVESVAFVSEYLSSRVEHYQSILKYANKTHFGNKIDILECPSIEFRNVFFKYPGNEEYTINDLSFKIEKGQKIALIGVNGAGKTTIIKLLLHFYEIESGEILINGVMSTIFRKFSFKNVR